MARQLRIEYAGAIYHAMSRRDQREKIFWDDADRQRFLTTLAVACAKTGWQVRVETTMTLQWVASRLQMRTWMYVAYPLGQHRKL